MNLVPFSPTHRSIEDVQRTFLIESRFELTMLNKHFGVPIEPIEPFDVARIVNFAVGQILYKTHDRVALTASMLVHLENVS